MAYAKDLTGQKFGKLTVISRNFEKQNQYKKTTGHTKAYWNCICDCGNKVIVSSSNLKNKTNPTSSCGCYAKQQQRKSKNTKENKWIFDGDVVIGITSSGDKFLIDADDFQMVKNYCWRKNKHGYIVANKRSSTNKTILLHRIVMNVDDDNILVDHKYWDKTDNRKSNLRLATKSNNNININRRKDNTSGYTGVTYNKRNNKYTARISKNGKRIFIGYFNTLEEAVEARHKTEIDIHKEWSGEINRKDYYSFTENE